MGLEADGLADGLALAEAVGDSLGAGVACSTGASEGVALFGVRGDDPSVGEATGGSLPSGSGPVVSARAPTTPPAISAAVAPATVAM